MGDNFASGYKVLNPRGHQSCIIEWREKVIMNVSRLSIEELKTSFKGHSMKSSTGVQFTIGIMKPVNREGGETIKLFKIGQDPHLNEPQRTSHV